MDLAQQDEQKMEEKPNTKHSQMVSKSESLSSDPQESVTLCQVTQVHGHKKRDPLPCVHEF